MISEGSVPGYLALCFWAHYEQNQHRGGGSSWQRRFKLWCVESKKGDIERMPEKAVTPRNTLPLTYFIQLGPTSQQHNLHSESISGWIYLLHQFSWADLWRWPHTHIERYASWGSQVFFNLIVFTAKVNYDNGHPFQIWHPKTPP